MKAYVKVYLRCWAALCFMFVCTNCHSDFSAQEEASLIHNIYKMPGYTLAEFQELCTTVPNDKIKNRATKCKWRITGTESEPYEIWTNFRKEREAHFPGLKKNTIIQNFFDCWGNLIKSPSASSEKEVIEAKSRLYSDDQAREIWEEAAAICHKPEKFFLTKSFVDYHRYFYFMRDKPNTTQLDELIECLEAAHQNLKVWKEEQHPMGVALWEKMCEQYEKRLKDCKYCANFEQEKKVIKINLERTDSLASSPYKFNVPQIQELAYGLRLLNKTLDVLDAEVTVQDVHKKNIIEPLKIYCKLIKLSPFLDIIPSYE